MRSKIGSVPRRDDDDDSRNHCFFALTASVPHAYVLQIKAANVAVKFAQAPSLKEQVESERQKRLEEEKRATMLSEAEERRQKRQAEREAFRQTMKGKYSLASSSSYSSISSK